MARKKNIEVQDEQENEVPVEQNDVVIEEPKQKSGRVCVL